MHHYLTGNVASGTLLPSAGRHPRRPVSFPNWWILRETPRHLVIDVGVIQLAVQVVFTQIAIVFCFIDIGVYRNDIHRQWGRTRVICPFASHVECDLLPIRGPSGRNTCGNTDCTDPADSGRYVQTGQDLVCAPTGRSRGIGCSALIAEPCFALYLSGFGSCLSTAQLFICKIINNTPSLNVHIIST